MRRLFWFVLAGCALVLSPSFARAQNVVGEPPVNGIREVPTLQEMLEKGLKVRRPEDFAFIDRVVFLVDRGVLPRSLVDSTFLYARRKGSRRAAFYFERALRFRAAEQGIHI